MGSYTGSSAVLLSGDIPDANEFKKITDFEAAEIGAWTTYSIGSTWTTSAGTVAVNNGTFAGAYRLIGKTLDWRLKLTIGSSTSIGSTGASWAFAMPAGLVAAGDATVLLAGEDVSAVSHYIGLGLIRAGLTFLDMYKSPSGQWLQNSPFTWATGDIFRFSAKGIEVT